MVFNIRGLFRDCLLTKTKCIGIGTIITSQGKVYYDPKHAAGVGSVAKLVKAGKSNKICRRMVLVSGHVHFA